MTELSVDKPKLKSEVLHIDEIAQQLTKFINYYYNICTL